MQLSRESMALKSRPVFRALSLVWSRMGSARFYILTAATLLLVLAALGVVHLVSSRATPGSKHSDSPVALSAPKDAAIAITEIGSTETTGRNGQRNVAVKIGVAPRPQTSKGEVEIRVLFFDVTPNGEMRPTDAEVNYEWLTPVRDWTDPTPKYLVATYLGAGTARRSTEKLRYGGFVARVYFDGQLQAERSEPKELVALLRNGPRASPSPAAVVQSQAQITAITPSPFAPQPRPGQSAPVENATATNPLTASPTPLHANRESSSAVPYASPVPDKPGFVYSPHNPKFLIDVRGFPPGTEVNDPNTGKPFKVP
ncbi:MAG: hypothetical protein QOG51_563 [Verrucomicrobiota bacterium]